MSNVTTVQIELQSQKVLQNSRGGVTEGPALFHDYVRYLRCCR